MENAQFVSKLQVHLLFEKDNRENKTFSSLPNPSVMKCIVIRRNSMLLRISRNEKYAHVM